MRHQRQDRRSVQRREVLSEFKYVFPLFSPPLFTAF